MKPQRAILTVIDGEWNAVFAGGAADGVAARLGYRPGIPLGFDAAIPLGTVAAAVAALNPGLVIDAGMMA